MCLLRYLLLLPRLLSRLRSMVEDAMLDCEYKEIQIYIIVISINTQKKGRLLKKLKS